MKRVLLCLLIMTLILPTFLHGQTVKSPSEFLGYELGTKFTYHHKVVDYFNYFDDISDQVKTYQYGETNERRELMVAYVSSPKNLQNLEEIRKNNLKRSGMLDGAISENDIAVVWLSYNVHGNEANSTETSMKVLYELVGPNKEKYKNWLDHLVIVIDPCLNPDGRDRYANWHNQVTNLMPNPDVNVREHQEGWTYSRSNHYMFDLNRDWVWQTQIESRQRLKLYNEWLPQVHVDFHEQYYDDNYYFAPAARPMHELITNWQKEFQELIGKNNGKYFDEKGWLYFTKEVFDLLYPGYGDTYPMYNGAIGMTYEMAGGSAASLAVKTEKGDTLTLQDRINKHFTTSIATLETCYTNRQSLLEKYTEFFNTRTNDSYILKSSRPDRIALLTELLDKNHISYKTPSGSSTIKGTSYEKNQDISIKLTPGDLVIPLNQPKSTLVKILFERNTKLEDTLTYDITAWSLPYVYGLDSYQTSAKLNLTEFNLPKYELSKSEQKPYAYLLNWTSIKDAEFLSDLLKMGITVNYFTESFKYDNQTFSEGTLVINRIDNEKQIPHFHQKVADLASELDRNIIPVYSGSAINGTTLGSKMIHFLKKPKVALLAGEGIRTTNFGEIWHFFEQEIKMPLNVINKNTISRINLDEYDVLILASGKYDDLSSEAGFKKLDTWIKQGGKLVLFEGAINNFIGEDKFSLEKTDEKKEDKKNTDVVLYPYAENERENLKNYIQGGIIKMELDNTHPLAYGYDKNYYTIKNNTTAFKYLEDGWNVGYITSENKTIAGFVGSETKEKLKKNLVFGVENRGRGQVVYFGDNPLFRAFWQNGKLFVANAVYFDN